jgi:hypothetical protein
MLLSSLPSIIVDLQFDFLRQQKAVIAMPYFVTMTPSSGSNGQYTSSPNVNCQGHFVHWQLAA